MSKTTTAAVPAASTAIAGKPTNGKPETAEQAKAPEIQPSTAPVPPITEQAPPSIAQRLQRFEELNKLKERREAVTDALQELGDFYVSPTGNATVKLTDSRGTTFTIGHPLVIADMVGSAKAKLQAELDNIDSQFLL